MDSPLPSPSNSTTQLPGTLAGPIRAGRNYIDELLIFQVSEETTKGLRPIRAILLNDNNLQVENYLFRVPVNVLRTSDHFRDMLDSSHVGDRSEGQTDDKPIILTGIAAKEMNHFLDVIFPRSVAFSQNQLNDI